MVRASGTEMLATLLMGQSESSQRARRRESLDLPYRREYEQVLRRGSRWRVACFPLLRSNNVLDRS